MKKLFTIFFMTFVFAGCNNQEPSAGFSSTSVTFFNGVKQVNFTNNSIDAESFFWSFGDGSTSTEQNPRHVYNKAGNYSVTLTAYGKKRKKESTITKVVVVPYDKAYITKFVVSAYPATDGNGSSWDISSNPDIYMRILSPNPNNTTLKESAVLNDATTPFFWQLGTRFEVPTNNEVYFLNLYDRDTPGIDSDDNMGAVAFRMSDYPTFPAQITRAQNGITVIIDVEWE